MGQPPTGLPDVDAQKQAAVEVFAQYEPPLYEAYLEMMLEWLAGVRAAMFAGGVAALGLVPDPLAVFSQTPKWAALTVDYTERVAREVLAAPYKDLFADGTLFESRPFVRNWIAGQQNRLSAVPGEVYGAVAQIIDSATVNGASIPDVTAQVEQLLSDTDVQKWKNRARTVARTEVVGAYNGGLHDAFAMIVENDPGTEWVKRWLCVLPDTPVVAADVRLAARRWYDGDTYELHTASGRRVALTPEHPVLTTEGWIPAKLIEPDHQLVSVPAVDPIGAPHVEAGYPCIQQCFDAAAEPGKMRTLTREMPGGVDLYSNSISEKVDVVAVERDLTAGLKSGAEQDFLHLCLELPDKALRRLVVQRAVAHGDVSDQPRCCDLSPASGGLQPGFSVSPDESSSALVPDGDSGPAQYATDGIIARSEPLAQGMDGLPGLIALDKVVSVEVVPWSGHVYDLTTSCHWFLADGIVVHNSTEDARTRPDHVEADGQTVPFASPFIVGGYQMMYPHDPTAPAKEVINCRCVELLEEAGSPTDTGNRGYKSALGNRQYKDAPSITASDRQYLNAAARLGDAVRRDKKKPTKISRFTDTGPPVQIIKKPGGRP